MPIGGKVYDFCCRIDLQNILYSRIDWITPPYKFSSRKNAKNKNDNGEKSFLPRARAEFNMEGNLVY